jgi:hypothetical protein
VALTDIDTLIQRRIAALCGESKPITKFEALPPMKLGPPDCPPIVECIPDVARVVRRAAVLLQTAQSALVPESDGTS